MLPQLRIMNHWKESMRHGKVSILKSLISDQAKYTSQLACFIQLVILEVQVFYTLNEDVC